METQESAGDFKERCVQILPSAAESMSASVAHALECLTTTVIASSRASERVSKLKMVRLFHATCMFQ